MGITPAYAGNTALTAYNENPYEDHPRIRGEHDATSYIKLQNQGSPPHTRGTRYYCQGRCNKFGITPAYAGNTPTEHIHLTNMEDHPRIRGEHVMSGRIFGTLTGSPPHTRGTLLYYRSCLCGKGITPAYAGNTIILHYRSKHNGDHPRIRGEHCRNICRIVRDIGITPAYAGNTSLHMNFPTMIKDHPRIRGEHFSFPPHVFYDLGSPPHTRGTH